MKLHIRRILFIHKCASGSSIIKTLSTRSARHFSHEFNKTRSKIKFRYPNPCIDKPSSAYPNFTPFNIDESGGILLSTKCDKVILKNEKQK